MVRASPPARSRMCPPLPLYQSGELNAPSRGRVGALAVFGDVGRVGGSGCDESAMEVVAGDVSSRPLQ